MRLGPYHLARIQGAARALETEGASIHVVQIAARDHYEWAPVQTVAGSSVETLFSRRAYDELSGQEIMSRVDEWLNGQGVDVVVTNGWAVPEARAALAWAARSRKRRAVVMSETKADEAPRVFWKEWVKRRILRNASAGLVGGEVQARYLTSLGVPRERIHLGYNAVDNHYFEIESGRVRRQSPPPVERPYFLACARFIARKNFDGLLRAYSAYRSSAGASAWDLVISGGGKEEQALRGLCGSLAIDPWVHWPGFVQYSELPRWYGHAGAFIHPAKGEPWGLVVNEAAACGLPLLVAAPVGARYELVEDGINGLVFDPFEDSDITRVLLRISEASEAVRAAMGEAARRRVADFGPERFGQGLVAAVRSALAAPR